MIKRYIEPNEYDKVIFDEGDYYPLIFNYAEDSPHYCVFMPIKDLNDDISVCIADSFEEAYKKSQEYLNEYYIKYRRYPKYVNPYQIATEDDEFLIMVKYD